MAVMHVPGRQPTNWSDVPPESPIKDLLDLRNRLDTGHRRAEIIEGRLVVSPVPVIWHQRVCIWLDRRLQDVSDGNGWLIDRHSEIQLPPTNDLIEPDLIVWRGADEVSGLESLRPLDQVLLVVEVVSRSSIREDREVKPYACALAGVPLYLLVDRFDNPRTMSLLSEPGPNGYATVSTARVGEKLRIPAPFDLTLDTSTLPEVA